MSARGWLLFLALSVIWGVPYLLIRVAVEDIDPLLVAFGRTFVGALVLLPIALHTKALRPVLRRWRPLLLFTAVEIAGPWLLLGHAETRLTSSTAGLLIAVVPLLAAVIVTRLGHDRLDARRLIGLGVGFAGVAALVGLDIHLSDVPAVCAVAVTAAGYAIGPVIITRSLSDVPPLGVVTGALIIATVGYAPVTPFVWPARVTADAAWAVLGLGVVCTAVAFVLFFDLVADAGPARATVITYVNPVVAVALGTLVLGEPLTIGMAIGLPLIIIGSAVGTARTRTPTPTGLPPVVPTDTWQKARDRLLVKEKAATRRLDAIAALRRRLPMVRIERDYLFEGAEGRVSLLDLFDGRRQLIVYHFMFGPDWDVGCPGCSRKIDDVGHLAHLNARDTSFAVVSLAPYARLAAFRQRKGWTVPWYSSAGSDFNTDMGATVDGDEEFGLSVFLRDGDTVYRSYYTTGRGVEPAGTRHLLDLTPFGRQEDWEDSPAGWPRSPTYGWGGPRDE
jgi:predicted dithiol-disulfide oxidoreductase (DUF899 family)/drug/metabolite transporter (DMT)-like permease